MQRNSLPIAFGWYGIALSDEIKPGEVKPLSYLGRHYVLFRTTLGIVSVLDAFCPHLGAHLGIQGQVKGEHLICPLHQAKFDSTGRCIETPCTEHSNKLAASLQQVSYPVHESMGVVWLWYHPHNNAPSFDVLNIPELNDKNWSDYQLFEWHIKASLQETAENAADSAHFQYVHGAQSIPEGKITHDQHQRQAYFCSLAPSIDEQGRFDKTGTKWTQTHLTTINNGPGQTFQRFTGFADVIMLGLITPIDQSHIHMRFAYKKNRKLNASADFLADCFIHAANKQVEEDIPIWENKRYRDNPILCDGDGPIHQFRRWFSQFYCH